MRHKRELMWWLVACALAIGLSTVTGGFLGPIIALFALVVLAGALLIEFEGPQIPLAEDVSDDDVAHDDDAFSPAEPVEVTTEEPVSYREPAAPTEVVVVTSGEDPVDTAAVIVDDDHAAAPTDTGPEAEADEPGSDDDITLAVAALGRATVSA